MYFLNYYRFHSNNFPGKTAFSHNGDVSLNKCTPMTIIYVTRKNIEIDLNSNKVNKEQFFTKENHCWYLTVAKLYTSSTHVWMNNIR